MKNLSLSICWILLTAYAVFGGGCGGQPRGVETGDTQAIHDERWHYDHDYDDNWRSHHPYRTGIFVAVHDDRWHYDNDYDDNWRSNHPWHGHRDW